MSASLISNDESGAAVAVAPGTPVAGEMSGAAVSTVPGLPDSGEGTGAAAADEPAFPVGSDGSEVIRFSDCIAPVFYDVHCAIRDGAFSEYWLHGGRGSAKSSLISLEIVLGLLKNPSANAIIYRKVASTLRESVYEQMVWAIERLGMGRYFQYRLSPLEIVHRTTGQRILFRGADDPGKSKSIKLARGYFAFLWFEELAEFSGMEDVRTIRASVIRGTGSRSRRAVTLYSYNPPQSACSWVNEEALVPHPGRMTHGSCYLDVPPDWLGSEFLAEAEALRQTNERAWKHMYLGEVTGTGGQVFDNLNLRPLTDADCGGRILNGLDFGFAVDPDAFIRVSYDATRRTLAVLDEFRCVRTPVERLAGEIRARAGDGVVRCDSADPRMIQQLRERGLNAVAVRKGPGSVAAGVRWLQELSEIAIDPERCPWAAKEFSAYEYGRGPDGEFLPEFPDRNNHLIDAARYAVEPLNNRHAARTESRPPWLGGAPENRRKTK